MTDELTGANNQLALFGKTFGQIKADWKKGYGLRSLSNVISADDMQQLKNYSKWLMNGTKSTEDFKDAMSYCSTATQKLGSEILKLKVKVDNGEMSTEEATTEMNRMIVAEETATGTTNALRSAFGKLALNLAISFAISALITLFTEMSQAEQKAIDKANELAQAYKTQQDTVSELKKEYIDIVDGSKSETEKTKDLYEWKKKLIKAYGYEKDAIEGVTTARATGLKFFDKEEYQNAKDYIAQNGDKYRDILKAFNNVQISGNGIVPDLDSIFAYNKPVLNNIDNIKKEVNDYLKEYGIVYNDLRAVDEYAYSLSLNYGENIYDAIKNINSVLSDIDTKELNNVPLTSFEKTLRGYLKSVLESLKKQVNDSKDVLSETGQAYFTKYFHEFLNIDANKLDNVTIDNFDEWKSRFNKYLEDHAKELLNDTNFNEIKDEYFSNLKLELFPNEVISQINQYGYSLSTLSEKFAELKDVIDDTSKKQAAIQSALEKIRQGTSLTTDEMNKVAEVYPDLLGKFKQTVDGWTISADDLIDANEKVTQSARDAIDEQRKILGETAEKIKAQLSQTPVINSKSDYEAWQKRKEQLNRDLTDIENQLKGLDNLSETLTLNLTNRVGEFSKATVALSSKMKTLSSAFKEQKENGSLSVDTVLTLIENGYSAALMYDKQTGQIKLNADAYLELARAEIEKQKADILIAQNEALTDKLDTERSITSNLGWAYLGTAEAMLKMKEAEARLADDEELIKALQEQYDVLSALGDQLGTVVTGDYGGSKSGSTSDPIKEAFEKDMKDIEHLHNMGLKSDEEYYDALEKANEKHYKNSADHESDYLSNVEKIYKGRQSLYKENADKQFDDLEDQRKRGVITAEQYAQALHDLGQELYGENSIYGGTEFAIKALEELDKKVKETSEDIYDEFKDELSADGDKTLFNILSDAEELWNKTNELFAGDLTSIKSNAKDIFGTVSSALEDALKKGIITVDGYESLLRSWANTLQVTETDVTNALVDTYEYRADALQKANDGSFASERKYIADMKSLNFSTYGDENSDFYDPNTYASNLRDITDHQLDVLEKALNNGEISVQEYANSVVEIFKDADVLGADYVSEKLDDIDKVRAEREKTYWEQQKELMEDYYDKQIKEIEDTQKAKEKENKLEELHLKLIKARQTLEEAKNNRNQLVFHDGTFEYMTDQDAVMSAEEDVANTLKEIENEKLQAQIDLLEEQKDAALGFYDQILDEIDFYLNKTLPLSESDQEELAKIRNSDYAQYARDKRDGNLTANSDNEKNAEDALNQTNTAEETKQSVSDIAKNVFDIAKIVADGFNFENLVRALGGNPTAEAVKNFQDSYNATLVGKQITPSTLPSNVTNNSSTTNNNNNKNIVVNVGDIHITVPEGMSKEDIAEYVAGRLSESIALALPKYLI